MESLASRATLLATLVTTVAMAGCFGGDEGTPGRCAAEAENVVYSAGWAYDGQGVGRGTGTFSFDVDDETNAGTASGAATAAGRTFTILFTEIVGTQPVHDGGIARGFLGHGDTGQGDTSTPALEEVCSAWGSGTLGIDGTDLVDPLSGNTSLSAHFMYTDTGVRDDASLMVMKKQGMDPYDPAAAADGKNFPGDAEVIVVLKSKGTAPPGAEIPIEGDVAPGSEMRTFEIPVEIVGATLAGELAVSPAAGAGPVTAEVDVVLMGPSGQELARATLGGTMQQNSWNIEFPSVEEAGPYMLHVEGQGAASYSGAFRVTYPPPVLHVFVFEDVRLVENTP